MSDLTNQEMFNRAWSGLKSQGFVQCTQAEDEHDGNVSNCLYTSKDGTKHCAWGWVDTSIKYEQSTGWVSNLRTRGIGLAADLTDGQMQFATSLQNCHDRYDNPKDMESALRNFASREGLVIPK
jgi:hypothetical protein